MRRLLDKLRAAARHRDQRDRRRRATLNDRHQEPVASGRSSIVQTYAAPETDNHGTDEIRITSNVGGNLLSPRSSPPARFDDDTIRKASQRCLSLFLNLKNIRISKSLSGPGTNEQTYGTLQDELVRFKLWASNIGVFADVHVSLDFRLRDLPDITELFLRQLDTIEERLKQGTYHSPSQYIVESTSLKFTWAHNDPFRARVVMYRHRATEFPHLGL
jgi:hypothetical protein